MKIVQYKTWSYPLVFLAVFLLVPFTACELPANDVPAAECQVQVYVDTTNTYVLQYNLMDPDKVLKLPGKLEEISGLSMSPDEKHLIAIQDEQGKIFWIDIEDGKVSRELDFWKDGDYEGVEMVEEKIYVTKSTGTIYKVSDWTSDDPEVVKFNTLLDGSNDVEGLGYDPQSRQLLLACKAQAGDGDAFKLTKAIYGFDLEKEELIVEPKFCIKLEQVNDYLNTAPAIRKLEKLEEFFAPGESEFGFSPSAIAVHPRTQEMYILSSVGKLLMIISPKGQILHIEKLKKSIHQQPEGICFDEEGNLYISNEGKGAKGTVFKFNFLP